MTESQKEVVYIDVDDEITSIIDKVSNSKHKIVALVLPKRASVMQSVVNMKLLKRTATEAKKHIVLITSEAGLMPLAGSVGVHVAKTPQSKPFIPPPPDLPDASETIISEPSATEEIEQAIDPQTPVGELAALSDTDEDETIEVDNSDDIKKTAPIAAMSAKGKKKFKIPNFEKFRTRLILGIGGLVVLLILLFIANSVLPKARIIVKTDTQAVTNKIEFAASGSAEELDLTKKILPAELKEVKKTDAEKVPTTGQKDLGTKATGKATITNCDKTDQTITVPSGTGISSGNLTFITSESATIPPSNFSGGGTCKNDSSKDVSVIAQSPGDQYNISPRDYTVAGLPSALAFGSAMSGGTSRMVKVVSDQDIESAKQKIGTRSNEKATGEVQEELKKNDMYGIKETFTASPPAVTASPTSGQEGAEVTVTSITTYNMLGVKENDLNKLIEEETNKQIDPTKQMIQKSGLEKATFKVKNKKSPTEVQILMEALTTAGPRMDIDSLKKEISGKKRGPTQEILQGRPGVKDVTVEYTPFWVFSTPKKTNRINLILEQAQE